MSNQTSTPSGTSFFGLLGILFIGLKLTGYITWSWWLVTVPLWGGLALVLVTFAVLLVFAWLSDRGTWRR